MWATTFPLGGPFDNYFKLEKHFQPLGWQQKINKL
jgi:hypothetical protein